MMMFLILIMPIIMILLIFEIKNNGKFFPLLKCIVFNKHDIDVLLITAQLQTRAFILNFQLKCDLILMNKFTMQLFE